jgi:hypothetical protein
VVVDRHQTPLLLLELVELVVVVLVMLLALAHLELSILAVAVVEQAALVAQVVLEYLSFDTQLFIQLQSVQV